MALPGLTLPLSSPAPLPPYRPLLQARMEAEAALATAADLQQRLGELEAATRVSGEDAARLKTLAKAGSGAGLGMRAWHGGQPSTQWSWAWRGLRSPSGWQVQIPGSLSGPLPASHIGAVNCLAPLLICRRLQRRKRRWASCGARARGW